MWHSTVPTSSKKFVFDLPLFKYSDPLSFWRGEYFIVNYFTLLIFIKFIKKSIVLNWHIYWLLCRRPYRLSCLEALLRLVGIRLNHVLININIHPSSKIAFQSLLLMYKMLNLESMFILFSAFQPKHQKRNKPDTPITDWRWKLFVDWSSSSWWVFCSPSFPFTVS